MLDKSCQWSGKVVWAIPCAINDRGWHFPSNSHASNDIINYTVNPSFSCRHKLEHLGASSDLCWALLITMWSPWAHLLQLSLFKRTLSCQQRPKWAASELHTHLPRFTEHVKTNPGCLYAAISCWEPHSMDAPVMPPLVHSISKLTRRSVHGLQNKDHGFPAPQDLCKM